ncbi:hypothetical protein OUZ56_007810 [Daphnia magna]|uniref:Uncharacterized protein n=1 Tax=Daphnia magna TaxID=35525 RepID=A0ABR0AB30_9CRUS|nr:hypothetical protein OUZ56_007810 [Daphnia magna]
MSVCLVNRIIYPVTHDYRASSICHKPLFLSGTPATSQRCFSYSIQVLGYPFSISIVTKPILDSGIRRIEVTRKLSMKKKKIDENGKRQKYSPQPDAHF